VWIGGKNDGRQLVYVKGANNNKVLVRLPKKRVTGIRNPLDLVGRFVRDWPLDLDDARITSESRYPPDVAGYNTLVNRMVRIFDKAVQREAVWVVDKGLSHDGRRKLHQFEVTVCPLTLNEDIQRMDVWFDVSQTLLAHTMLYDSAGRLVEDYDWQGIQLGLGLTDADFELTD
jgi:hypothetical protein